jgi:uncharacterized RDD family membrane protein YckC
MNTFSLRRFGLVLMVLAASLMMFAAAMVAHAQQPASTAKADSTAPAAAPADASHDDESDQPEPADRHHRHDRLNWRDQPDWREQRDWTQEHMGHGRHGHHGDQLISIGHDSTLPSGQHAAAVVSILGSSSSEGDAQDVVSVLGNTRVSGPVSDNAVAILGNTYIDSKVDGNAVAVLGSVQLGPHAEVGGDVVSILGHVHRDPAAVIHGDVENVLAGSLGDMSWLHTWIHHCLLYGRPLALVAGLGWAWTLALALLAFYAGLALLFRSGLSQCVQTVETQPGRTALAALLTMLLTPVLLVLLCVTVVGIAAVPLVVFALFCAALFGKAVMLAWIGHRVLGHRPGAAGHPAFAVLIGGALMLVLYLVPVLGFLVYKLLGIFGLGAVVYTLVLAARARQAAKAERLGSSAPHGATGAATASDSAAASGAAPAAAISTESVAGATPNADTPQPANPAPPSVSAALPRAGFWIRMAALFLDILLIGVVLSMLHPLGHFHLLILATYGAVMWKLRGSTVGGIVFDLRVVRLDGRELDWETAIVRALGCFLSLAAVGLGFIWIAFDDANQAWHDKIAGTVVVRVPKGVPLHA